MSGQAFDYSDVVARCIVIASFRRSGTHLTLDSLRLNSPDVADAFLTLSHLFPDHPEHVPLPVFLDRIRTAEQSFTLIKTHMQRDLANADAFFEGQPAQRAYLDAHPEVVALIEQLFSGARRAYVRRDGRDVMVSLYYYLAKTAPGYESRSFCEHVREYASLWKHHVRSWQGDGSVVWVSYESWANDYAKSLKECQVALGLRTRRRIQHVYGGFNRQPTWRGLLRRVTGYAGLNLTTVMPRKGVVGDWVTHFGPEERVAFRELAGDLLIELGYVPSHNW
jgi:hypothetical protein